ncbi:MAG: M20/M25/M40 family metallo-hydrolase, partial [Planctomycetota bacterium]|nr:M20/M25/M40 family metallo-hydrolase [Planctomycetota bacterium]
MTAIAALNATVDAREKEIVELLRALVKIPSLTGEEQNIGDFVAEKCREFGLSVDIIEAAPNRPNVVAIWDTGISGPTLLLNDHLDTFPPGEIKAWAHHPYAADIADGYIHGRGTIDTKSGLTTLLMAVHALKKARTKIRGKLKLVFSCDEETGGSKLGIRHLAKLGLLNADMALVAEPTTMRIEIATKSQLAVQITTHGKATHGARPWLGHNAILDMTRVIDQLLKLNGQIEQRKHELLGPSSLNIGTISGGIISNIVPDKCLLEINRRLVPEETKEAAYGEISEIVGRLNAQVPEFNGTVEERL